MQRSNGFVIELPSTANFILFWESADTHARARASERASTRTRANEHERARQDEMEFVRLFVARDRPAGCRKVFQGLRAAIGEK